MTDVPNEPTMDERLAAAASLEGSVRGLAVAVGDLATKMKTTERFLHLVRIIGIVGLISLSFDIGLTVWIRANQQQTDRVARQAKSIASLATSVHDSAVQTCVSENKRRVDDLSLWNKIFTFPSPIDETPAAKAVREKQTVAFREFLNQHDAAQDCSDTAYLGPYPTQLVTNRVDGIAGPAAHYGETLVITGTLCNRTKTDLPVLTTINWQAVDHTGTFIQVGANIQQTRKAGCEDFVGPTAFHNPMPPEVVAATKALAPEKVRWVVSGSEVPVLPNGSHGRSQDFTSEPFFVVP